MMSRQITLFLYAYLSCVYALQCPLHERYLAASAGSDCQCEAGYSRHDGVCTACPQATFKEYSGDSAEHGPACFLLSGCCACRANTITLSNAAVHASSCICVAGYGGSACTPCSVGYYKSSTSLEDCQPCPDGASTVHMRSISAEDCVARIGYYGNMAQGFTMCAAGSYAPTTGMTSCIQCPLGAISVAGASREQECKCELEGWSTLSANACTCLPGYARDMHNMCRLCQLGFYCAGADSPAYACPVNSISPTGASKITDCICNSGYTGVDGGPCLACDFGQWKRAQGSADCSFCPENTYSNVASIDETACLCNPGLTGDDGGPCTACSVGKYKDSNGSEICVHCMPHSTTLTTASFDASQCVCEAGYELIDGVCKHCAVGHYKENAGSGLCVNECPAHSSGPEGSISITNCECNPGYFGIAADNQCQACAVGTYKTNTGSGACTACTGNASTFALASTNANYCACKIGFSTSHACRSLFSEECICTECPVNHYGSHTSVSCLECPENTYSAAASTEPSMCKCRQGFENIGTQLHNDLPLCTLCAVGKFWTEQGCVQCPEHASTAGSGAKSIAECLCLPGYFMQDIGTARCHACPEHTYQSLLGGSCTSCAANAISAPASRLQTDCFCKPGFTGEDGKDCTACAVAHYKESEGSDNCKACVANTTSSLAASKKTDCTCVPGFVGPAGGPCQQCPESTYELEGVCVNCPQNTFAPRGSFAVQDCQCKAGFSGPAQGPCIECEYGYYKGRDDDVCIPCGERMNTSSRASINVDACVCIAGYWMNDTICEQCPDNTYKANLGSEQCKSCPLHSTGPAASQSIELCVCFPGFLNAGDGTCDKACAAGFETKQENSAICVGCNVNFYKATYGNDTCKRCPSNSFTMFVNSTNVLDCICDAGYVWDDTTQTCKICAPGYFNSEVNSTACYACVTDCETEHLSFEGTNRMCPNLCKAPAGYEIATSDASKSSIIRCAENHYQDGTSTKCSPCPCLSTYSPEMGLTSVESCTCRPGYHRVHGVCTACERGTFKSDVGERSDSCKVCPENMTTLLQGSTDQSACICAQGYTLLQGICQQITCPTDSILVISDATAICKCQKGYEAISLYPSLTCVKCAEGYFKDSIGNEKCLSCGAHTVSFQPRNNRSLCACAADYEAGLNNGPDVQDGFCVRQCPAGEEGRHGICKACKNGMFKNTTGQTCIQCPGVRSVSPVRSTHVRQCSCPERKIEIEEDDIAVVEKLGEKLQESIQSISGNNSLLYMDSSTSLFELYINNAGGEITVTVGQHIVFFCARGTCSSTIINMQGMRGIVNATCISLSQEPTTKFTLSWYAQQEVFFKNPGRGWVLHAMPQAQALAAKYKISAGVSIFRASKLFSQNAAICTTCPSNLICSLLI